MANFRLERAIQKSNVKKLVNEFQNVVYKFGGLFGEYLISNDNDYLLCHFSVSKKGLQISGNFCEELFFGGDVINENCNGFLIPFDPLWLQSIDSYLELASDEIQGGYLLPNNLYFEG